uniref:Cation/H+ exchanger transmembrane domain-containing protein n=1 Tax=Parascaris equorum TaxID=6256 RepID=A0A914RWD9_PAREQ
MSTRDQYVNSTMSIFILWLSSIIIGSIFQFIRLPNLIGVLLTGIAYKNIPLFDGLLFIDERWSRFFRKAALTGTVFRLGIISTLCEVCAIFLASHFLFGISGIPTALLASCAIDNMTCIAAYGVSVALIFTTVKITYEMAITFTTIVLSVVGGIIGGRILWVFPHEGSHHVHFTRGVLLLSVCLALNYGTLAIDCPSAGYKEAEALAQMWNFFAMQIMFSLTGYEFDLRKIHARTVFKAVGILGVGTVTRIIVVFCLSFGSGLRLSEQLFMSLGFLSKATLQNEPLYSIRKQFYTKCIASGTSFRSQ